MLSSSEFCTINKKVITMIRKTSNIESLKEKEHITLLTRNSCPLELLKESFPAFIQEVYELCLSSTDRNNLYFTLQYTRQYLLGLQKITKRNNKLDSTMTETIAFLETTIDWLFSSPNTDIVNMPKDPPIVWTGKVINFVEWIYGPDSLKHFNDGNVTIKELVGYLGNALGIKIKDPSGCYVDMRDRIGESRTTYIDSMKEALISRMERDDEKKYKRKK